MRRLILSAFTLTAVACLVLPLRGAGSEKEQPTDEATKLAAKLTEEGAATFDTFNAKAMADYYLEDGEISLITKEEGRLKFQDFKGKAEVEKEYGEVFKKPETIKSRNTVTYARLVNPEILEIAGTFDTNTLKPDSFKVPFYQVRHKQGDKWLIAKMQIMVFLGK